MAEQSFNTGYELFQQNHYEQALVELQRAECGFRTLDARGHPFSAALPNGVSGLANALALAGQCHLYLRNWEQAAVCFETSLINAQFEKKRSFQVFLQSLKPDIVLCYSQALKQYDEQTLGSLLRGEIEIDTAFCFPFSLNKKLFPLARLYELAPKQYPQFKGFYSRARETDLELERSATGSDRSRLKITGIAIWVVLGTLWALFSLLVSKALFIK
jgi:tetratricopeptide (TPR) repeat protein